MRRNSTPSSKPISEDVSWPDKQRPKESVGHSAAAQVAAQPSNSASGRLSSEPAEGKEDCLKGIETC